MYPWNMKAHLDAQGMGWFSLLSTRLSHDVNGDTEEVGVGGGRRRVFSLTSYLEGASQGTPRPRHGWYRGTTW